MMFLLFLFLGTAAVSGETFKDNTLYVSRVRQPPSVFFRCNVFFVSTEYLVGSAACFLCNQNCTFQVVVGKSDLNEDDKQVYDVSKVFMHPKYVRNTGNMYNIAVVKLEKPVTNAVVLQLANKTSTSWGQVSTWTLSDDLKKYFLQPIPFRRVSPQICKEGNIALASDEYCAGTTEGSAVVFGANNEGVPHVLGVPNTVGDKKPTVLGFRNRIDKEIPRTFFAFTSIPHYYSWIMSIISSK